MLATHSNRTFPRNYNMKSLARLSDYLQVVFEDPTANSIRENEFEAICGNLRLLSGEKLLEIGCELLTYAAKMYGVKVFGITTNRELQAKLNLLIAAARLQGSVVKLMDYRNPVAAKFDKAVCLTPFITVGRKEATTLFGSIYNSLHPGGLFLTRYITTTRPSASSLNRHQTRLAQYVNSIVHPSLRGECLSFNDIQLIATQFGFEITLVEDLSELYLLRLQRWLDYLQTNQASIKNGTSKAIFYAWSMDLSLLASGIKLDNIRLYQILFSKPTDSHNFVSLPDSRRCCGVRHTD